MNRRHVAVGIVCSLVAATWIFAAPLLGLPVGVWGSTGDSMGNDGVMIHVWADLEPEVGDVVIYDQKGQLSNNYVAHRVVGETEAGYVTKGDANGYTDQSVPGVSPVTEHMRIGTVVFEIALQNLVAIVLGGAATVGGIRHANARLPRPNRAE